MPSVVHTMIYFPLCFIYFGYDCVVQMHLCVLSFSLFRCGMPLYRFINMKRRSVGSEMG